MKVKIVKCSNESWWYNRKNMIGKVVEVFYENGDDYCVELSPNDNNGLVLKEDCIILKEDEMNKEKLKNQIEEMESKLAEMKQELENIEDVDWLQNGVRYWYICDGGYIDWTKYYSHDEDIYRKSIGNTYKTEALAERKRDKAKNDWVLQKLIKVQNYVDNLEEDWLCDWNDLNQCKYYIYYDYSNNTWYTVQSSYNRSNSYHMNKKTAERVVTMLNGGEL